MKWSMLIEDQSAQRCNKPQAIWAKGKARTSLLIALSSVVLSWPLIWNGFPFIYWDTATYVERGAVGSPIFVQPIYYAYWLRLFHPLPYGLTICGLAQAMVTCYLLLLLTRQVVARNHQVIAFALAVCLIVVSPTVFYVTAPLADVSTLWLAFGAAIFAASGERRISLMSATAILIALSFHYAHVLIFCGLMPLVLIASYRRALKERAIILASVLLCFAGLYAFNNLLGGQPPFSSASLFMTAARLNQSGSLHHACEDLAAQAGDDATRNKYQIWARGIEHLTRESETFLWDKNSPLNLYYNGWSTDPQVYKEAKSFIAPVVSYAMQKYLDEFLHFGKHNITSMLVGENMEGSFVQHDPNSPDAWVYVALNKWWPSEAARYASSKQAAGILPRNALHGFITTWKRILYTISIISILAIAALALWGLAALMRKNQQGSLRLVALILLMTFALNVFVCGMLSSDATRYIEKVTCLPLIAFTLIAYDLLPVIWRLRSTHSRYSKRVHG